jgi:ankyrin repeat protein
MRGWLMASCPYILRLWVATMVVQFLLEHGATVDAGDEYNETALYFALANGHLGVARLLLDHGADPNIQGSRNCWYDRPSGGMS